MKRFVAAFLAGTADARSHPARALAILRSVTASDPKFLARATPATLQLLAGPHGVGCLSVGCVAALRRLDAHTGLLKTPIPAASVVDASFLPARCR